MRGNSSGEAGRGDLRPITRVCSVCLARGRDVGHERGGRGMTFPGLFWLLPLEGGLRSSLRVSADGLSIVSSPLMVVVAGG